MLNKTTSAKQKADKITYVVVSSASEKATDKLERKIEKLILRDMKNNNAVTTAKII